MQMQLQPGMLTRALSWTEPLHSKCERIREELGLPHSLHIAETVRQAEDQLGLAPTGLPLPRRIDICIQEMGIAPAKPPAGLGYIVAPFENRAPAAMISAEAVIVDDSAAATTIQAAFRRKKGLPEPVSAVPIVVGAVVVETVPPAPPHPAAGMPPPKQPQAGKPPAAKKVAKKSPPPKAIVPIGDVPVTYKSGSTKGISTRSPISLGFLLGWLFYTANVAGVVYCLITGVIIAPYPLPLGIVLGLFLSTWHLGNVAESLKQLQATNAAARLHNDKQLRAYAGQMQKSVVSIHLHVRCWHTESRERANRSKKPVQITVTRHSSKHVFAYSTCADQSAFVPNYKPFNGVAWRPFETDRVAVVQSCFTWKCAPGATHQKLQAEKHRLYEANKHRDRNCEVKVVATLPGRKPTQLYIPDGAPAPAGATPTFVSVGLSLCGLGIPLILCLESQFTRRIQHNVHKVISL